MKQSCGHVALVGAGCGGVGWLTVQGLALLRACDAVVYDELLDPALLLEAPEGAERFPVGKRAGKHSARQEDINGLLVRLARQGKAVVRLKGGDPYVFGRGGEEALALREAGVSYEVAPGISSALAVPLEAGIPVTHRAVSRSVHIVTAHTAEDALPERLEQLARLGGTLVFLMGLGRLPRLARALTAAGMAPETPAAVLSGGSAPHPARVRGTLADIADRAALARVEAPAVIVVGDTAAMDLRSEARRALSGVRVGLTGTPELRNRLRTALEALGAETATVQATVCEELPTPIPWAELDGGRRSWLVFTSARGVEFFFRRTRREEIDARRLGRCKFAVIGRATGDALWRHGFRADLCPSTFTSAALADALAAETAPEDAVWLFQAERGSAAVGDRLGRRCRVVPLYRADYRLESVSAAADYLLFGSAGAVRALADAGYRLAEETAGVCIGPVSARAFEERFGRKALVPAACSVEGLVQLLAAREAPPKGPDRRKDA